MKTPLHQYEGIIYDATGSALAACENESIAALIVEQINTRQAQYAAGYEAATTITNARRDQEVEGIRKRAEQRGYDRAYEELGWSDLTPQPTLVA